MFQDCLDHFLSLRKFLKKTVIYELIGEKLLVAIKAVRKAEIDDHSNNPEAYKELIHTALRILIAEKCKESP
ncbi:hypothetical protein NC651_025167 [Populus alba x Populus x berolinensis]|nr:hypothetical protein NC651_025167 [Populus alba x Populus x berolinensis]